MKNTSWLVFGSNDKFKIFPTPCENKITENRISDGNPNPFFLTTC